MFSANENLVLRQHKRRIVQEIEATIPDDALDMGTTVMVMQVSCKAPGCVPLETAIIIVFPNSPTELIPGLPESKNGGNYKTKILKPMADVENEDILEALPPAFKGGRRTMEKLCVYARDVMLAQITQLFGEEEDAIDDRRAMAEYLQSCLQDYMANGCKAPEQGKPFSTGTTVNVATTPDSSKQAASTSEPETNGGAAGETKAALAISFPASGNLVIRRVTGEATSATESSVATTSRPNGSVYSGKGPAKHNRAIQSALNPSSNITKLFEREHAPGIRQAGCPCCDPDNPSNIVDTMMML